MKIQKILIANRSEVARRIQESCKPLGIKTVAIYAQQDAALSYVIHADQAVSLSSDGLLAYMQQDEIISIAQACGVDAIHPGYGFLSENADFAQKVIDAGIVWIGPRPETIRLMGDKACARACVQDFGGPIAPGHELAINDSNVISRAKKIATEIGYPILLKDPLAGGGKAIRRVGAESQLESAWQSVLREGKKLTNSTSIVIEKYLENARHVEVQVAGDGSNAIHLFERECSIQRRHQKIIEEAPCAFISAQTRQKICESARMIAHKLGYEGVGTIEFLLLLDESFYFLEMNTRLQVEHPVTELTTQLDLVALQIAIAETKMLPFEQNDIRQYGSAIECRIYSEDPKNDFFPSVGKIQKLVLPQGPFVRTEHDLHEGMEITPFFDPMIAKLIVFGRTRQDAITHLATALDDFVVVGIQTNISFLKNIITSSCFKNGNFSTQIFERSDNITPFLSGNEKNNDQEISDDELAALVMYLAEDERSSQQVSQASSGLHNRWKVRQWK